MKKYLALAFSILLLGSCQKKEATIPETVPEIKNVTTTKSTSSGNCYKANVNGNIIELQLEALSKNTEGTLTYAFTGQAISHGRFKGQWQKDLLIANYTFQSEGKIKELQVVFKLVKDQLVEGYGERAKNSTQFKDISKLSFNYNMPLKKVACP